MATEGGHVDFAPRTDQEIELLRYLRGKVGGRVSIERVLSGPGFYDCIASYATALTYPNLRRWPRSYQEPIRTRLLRN
jgi:glucokinase